MSETRLMVFRHGPVVQQGLCYGQSNPETRVSEDEFLRIEKESTRLLASGKTCLWTSPAERCRLIANRLSLALPLACQEDALLWEIAMGQWEGLLWSDLEKNHDFVQWMKNWKVASPPGGESVTQLQSRVERWLSQLDRKHNHIVVAHAGVIRSLMVHLQGVSWEVAMKKPVPHLQAAIWNLQTQERLQ